MLTRPIIIATIKMTPTTMPAIRPTSSVLLLGLEALSVACPCLSVAFLSDVGAPVTACTVGGIVEAPGRERESRH